MEKIAPVLIERGVQFKAPSSLKELGKINSGLYYGYSQVGKTITVYSRSSDEAVSMAWRLHQLTRGMAGPQVPFDLRYRPTSNVYYRYGAFTQIEIEREDGGRIPAVRDPKGNLVPDSRERLTARPDWVKDLFPTPRSRYQSKRIESPLVSRFRVFRALTQRGKGGVYQAIDMGTDPPRLCLLKEGRRHGETRWDGCDGASMVRNEKQALLLLGARGLDVPRVYSSFEVDGNVYLVMEFIDGENLQKLLARLKRRLSIACALRYGIQLSGFFSALHASGWVWRDCKPMNIIVTRCGILRPLDFEGACPSDKLDPLRWVTPGFSSPRRHDHTGESGMGDDRYALGALLYLLLTGRVPESPDPVCLQKFRRNIPSKVCEIVLALLSLFPRQRPSAELVANELTAALAFSRVLRIQSTNGLLELEVGANSDSMIAEGGVSESAQ